MRSSSHRVLPDASTLILTLLALVAFASNSLLTRLAVGTHHIDAATFNAVRFGSGAVALLVLSRGGRPTRQGLGAWAGPIALIVYAAPFSFAYARIGAAVGALVLFGVSQLTMVAYGLTHGERPKPLAWAGLALATSGLTLLTLRSAVRPDPTGLLLMATAGIGWGTYSLAGRSAVDPIASNTRNFVWSAPLAIALPFIIGSPFATARGVVLALISGVIGTALGYVAWYRAVRRVGVVPAAVAQLAVPVLAGLGGVLLLDEPLTGRLVVSGVAVLAGIALTLVARSR